jgi:hypothetical protein
VHFEPCASARTRGNVRELRDAFVAIVDNALDAQRAGGYVEIKTIARGSVVGVQIRDGGPGMSDEVRARAFDPYFTTSPESRRGLGLSLAHAAIVRSGGRLSVKSGPTGSSFQVIMPADSGEDASGDVARGGALVVVENRLLRLRVAQLFEERGVPVVHAADTRDVVWCLDVQTPSVVVVDEAALDEHRDRLVTVCRALDPDQLCVLVAREIPPVATALAVLPNVRVVAPEEVDRIPGLE